MKRTADPIKLSLLALRLKATAVLRGFKRSSHEQFAV